MFVCLDTYMQVVVLLHVQSVLLYSVNRWQGLHILNSYIRAFVF